MAFFFLSPIDQKVPLGETEWTGGWCCPTTSQCQDNVGVSPLHNAHLNIYRLPEDFCDRIISTTVVGRVGLIPWGTPPGFNQNQVWNALGRQDLTFSTAFGDTLAIGQSELHPERTRSSYWWRWRNRVDLHNQSFNRSSRVPTLEEKPVQQMVSL